MAVFFWRLNVVIKYSYICVDGVALRLGWTVPVDSAVDSAVLSDGK